MKPTVLASAVLALALMGDALLYPILPLHASALGLSMAWVGILLSANRVVRLFAFQGIASAAGRWGLRRVTIAAAITGASSTIAFALADGESARLAARIVWGLAYGILALSTLAYATAAPMGAGKRIGVSLSVREIGPLLALTAGIALVAALGPRAALLIVGGVSLFAVPLAFMLPQEGAVSIADAPKDPWSVTRHDILSATMGFVIDGIFVTTIGLAYAEDAGIGKAAAFVASMLVARRVALVLISPVGGRVGDAFGAARVLLISTLATAAGLMAIASGWTLVGSAILVGASAVAITVLPAAATEGIAMNRIAALARLNVARDVGAAAGPLCAASAWGLTGTGILYVAGAMVLTLAALAVSSEMMARTRELRARV